MYDRPVGDSHFNPKLFEFLADLDRNNNKVWFAKNKHRYVDEVQGPVRAFVADFGPHLRELSRHLVADPRPVGGSMFRIYRDTRFSKDKRPYKTNVGLQFRHARSKDVHTPGYYLHLGIDRVFAAAGIWHPDGGSLRKIREAIVKSPSRWRMLLSAPPFEKGRLQPGGASLKRPPRGFDPDHPLIEDLKRIDLYVCTDLSRKEVCAKGFIDQYASICRDGLPFLKFLARALGLPL